MTEYGRGRSPEPWHPEDPLYGDQGWAGQASAGQGSYGGQQQHYPQQPQQPSYGGQQGYGGQQPGYPQHDYNGGWDTGQNPAYDPYGGHDTYGGQPVAYGGERPDQYGTPDAYPPPRPPGRRREVQQETPDWDPGPDQGEHAFFANRDDDDDYDDYDDGGRSGGGGRGERRGRGGKKRRGGCACLVLSLVFAGGLGAAGYYGIQFYKDRFGAAEDYAGGGSGQVSVEIPKGATGYDIGNKLKEAGVVKSVDAFVAAQGKDPKGQSIQAGVYLMKKEMSAESAVDLMLDPKSRNNLVISEGMRNSVIYREIDKRLEQPKGTTEKYAKKNWQKLGLPDWAKNDHPDVKDHLEGFLYPSSYPVAKGMKPETVLKDMVENATEQYDAYDLESKAEALNLKDPLDVISVASLVQAEGKTHADFRKMSEVVYNRLKPSNTETNQLLQFDSTFNYLKGQSEINISEKDILTNKDPYNTYTRKGLPPGPISNPGKEAMGAALKPTEDGWMYFVATDGMNKTEFAKTHAEFLKLKEKFNANTGSD
ncbi:endolytic transglycosylase MltG [Streptomyces triticagri]|uniref:Endolytic murein transglycosylase n=1 Tax=Streptomyces triticagri TaxID=2293568 RepID=A0A372M041_9ACTN|nr:endolytic transglycosylase MltG [Streptomyces triticagri]RFU84251.1 endolytic transglycosylase MltG [Streptomyces triticagri]